MINKTVLRMISRFRDLLELAKTEFVCDEEFDKEMFCGLIKRWYNDTSMRGRRWRCKIQI